MSGDSPSRVRVRSIWLAALLVVAVLLRFWAFPYRYEFRDVDEGSYLQGGLQLIEGLPPPLHYAPGAPEAWIGWLHAGVLSCGYMALPTPEERQVALQVRPFTAVNHALFDLDRDMSGLRIEFIVLTMLLSLLAVVAGFRLGLALGGVGGAILVGGLTAFVPMLIEHSALAKPYSMAWSLAIIALYYATRPSRRSRLASAILMGLAISSRIEMLELLPLACILLWTSRTSVRGYLRSVVGYVVAALLTAQFVAPWLLTNLLGNLRAIFSVRFGPPPGPRISWPQMLRVVAWNQGLGPVVVLLVAAAVVELVRRRPAEAQNQSPPIWWLVVGLALLMFATSLQNTGYGTRYHGPAFIAVMIAAPLAIASLARVWPRAVCYLVAVAIAVPLYQGIHWTWAYRRGARPEDATAWIEAHVPPGTVVYTSSTFHDPLPTPQSADAIWNEVAGSDAAARKFKSGLVRFGLSDTALPHALSEQMMVTERAGPRRWYILGSRAALAGPRFVVRPFYNSAVFGLQDPVPEFNRTGGILVWRGDGPAPGLSAPIETWTDAAGAGTYVYASPDLRNRLH